MTVYKCDFCGKIMDRSDFAKSIENIFGMVISRNGIQLDVCDDCKASMDEWIKSRKRAQEEADADKG